MDYYFPAEGIESARKNLRRVVERGEGVGLLIGPPGSGKTTLLLQLAGELDSVVTPVVVRTCHGEMTRHEMLQTILFELSLKYQGWSEGEARLFLMEHLQGDHFGGKPLALLVDEARHLSVELLEELRLLSDLSKSGTPLMHLVVCGTSALEETLSSSRMESFNQRIAARCYLESFDRDETRAYVASCIASAGAKVDRVFTPEALENVYRASDGVPRVINQICDASLILAAQLNRRVVEPAVVEEAWAELQQLPTPWNDSPATSSDSGSADTPGVIEFGSLDSDDSAEFSELQEEFSEASDVETVETATVETALHVEESIAEEFAEESIAEEPVAEESIARELLTVEEEELLTGEFAEEDAMVADELAEDDPIGDELVEEAESESVEEEVALGQELVEEAAFSARSLVS
ncbi:MAG: AAA family ATPase, partial [Planctomycetales bacterium]